MKEAGAENKGFKEMLNRLTGGYKKLIKAVRKGTVTIWQKYFVGR